MKAETTRYQRTRIHLDGLHRYCHNGREEAFRALYLRDIIARFIQGYDDYLSAVIDQCFGESKPEGYIRALKHVGRFRVLHHYS